MTTTKLKIDLNEGILEIEGSETFVKMIYTDFKANFIQETKPALVVKPMVQTKLKDKPTEPEPELTKPAVKPAPAPTESAPTELKPKTKKKPTISIPIYNLVDDLNLAGTKDYPSLTEFTDLKVPITNEERNLIFLYYLQNLRKMDEVTINHLYTCYKAVNIRAPFNIEHSLQTTAQQYGWIDIFKNGKINVTAKGKEYVEKYLPKKGVRK